MAKAIQFMEAAEALALLGEASAAVIATNYVHAGIAAADVVCCRNLGHHASGPNHDEARRLLALADPALVSSLSVLLAMKSDAGYGAAELSTRKLLSAARAARKLVDAAQNP